MYVGGDFGVYYTANVAGCAITGAGFQNCWGQLGSNLPNAPVTDLKVYNTSSGAVLEAATYGRGIWTIALPSNAVYPQATLSPGSYNFGPLGVGTTNTPATFSLSNTGTVPLNISNIVAAPASDYTSPGNTCGTTLAGGSTCTIQVSFKPSATGDRRPARLADCKWKRTRRGTDILARRHRFAAGGDQCKSRLTGVCDNGYRFYVSAADAHHWEYRRCSTAAWRARTCRCEPRRLHIAR